MSEKKSFSEKVSAAIAVGLGLAAAAALLPQDKVIGEGLPTLLESFLGVLRLGWSKMRLTYWKHIRPVSVLWLLRLWRTAKWWLILAVLVLVSGSTMAVTGIESGRILMAVSEIMLGTLGLLALPLLEGMARILYLHLKVGGAFADKAASLAHTELPEILDEEDYLRFKEKLRFILIIPIVLTASSILLRHSPTVSTLKWLIGLWGLVAFAAMATKFLGGVLGKMVRVLLFAALVLICGSVFFFLLDRMTGGALSFDPVRTWIWKINASEVILALLALPALFFFMKGAFKSASDRKKYWLGAFCIGLVCAGFGFFLYRKRTITSEEIWGVEPERVREAEPASASSPAAGATSPVPPAGPSGWPASTDPDRVQDKVPPRPKPPKAEEDEDEEDDDEAEDDAEASPDSSPDFRDDPGGAIRALDNLDI